MKEKGFVIDTIIQQIRNGMLLRKPVIYLQTPELEIVRRVLNSDQVVVRMAKYSADTVKPFSKIHTDCAGRYYGSIVDYRVINMEACAWKDLPGKICSDCSNDESYGRIIIDKNHYCTKSTRYLMPLLLAVHVRTNTPPYDDPSAYDALLPFIDRYQQEADQNGAVRSSVVLLYGEQMKLPSWLTPYCYIVEEPYPDREEIAEIIREKNSRVNRSELPEDTIESYVSGFLGNTLIQVESTVDYLMNLPSDLLTGRPAIENRSAVEKILAALKEQNVKRSGLLELQQIDEKENLGGMAVFYEWLQANRSTILKADYIFRKTGAAGHKGILMCGIPGCGKSAAVNLLGKELKLPVLKMDIGRLMGGIVGESEHNMHTALKLAEAMAPCILFIDEIEKGFSGSNAQNGDGSGVTKRMFGILLSWMQECTKPVYMFATANSLSGIPKEFFRSGRFDSHFALYMPTYRECIDILKARMKKAEATVMEYEKGRKLFMQPCYEDENLGCVVSHLLYEENGRQKGHFMTGADIAKIVNMALREFSGRAGAISHVDWIRALTCAADAATVYGDGDENLDSIAVCYLRMLRLGFRPASEDCLFQPQDYSVMYGSEGIIPSIVERNDFNADYDRVLYQVIREKMLFLAARLEENTLAELTK